MALRRVMLFLVFVVAGCASSTPLSSPQAGAAPRPGGGSEPTIRVLVLSSSGSATVASTGAVKITGGGKILLSSDRGGTVSLQRAVTSGVIWHSILPAAPHDARPGAADGA